MDGDETAIVTLGPGVSRDIAGQLRGANAVLAPDELPPRPEGEVRLTDLLGLRVLEPTGVVLGTVSEVFEGPANDAFAIERPDGRHCVLPVIDAVIEDIDLARGEIRVGDITPFVVEE